ncbi:MAG: FAD-dependent oxidoreductase [Bdellovibrionota bacterium]
MADPYNLVVIGGGSAGLVSAYIGAAVKAKVALIEKNKMGGDCLNTGCVPSKALIRSSRFIAEMKRHHDFGIKEVQYNFDFKDVMQRVHQIIGKIEPHDSIERYTNLGVECFTGEAKIIDKNTVEVNGQILKTKNIILAMGAEPLIPPLKGLEKINYLTSDNLWELQHLPQRLIVLGGGPIGSEMTQAFARLGSNVTQVEMEKRILGREDDDVAAIISQEFLKDGVHLLTDAKAVEVQLNGNDKLLICELSDGKIEKIVFDEILVAVGRRPRTDEVDWEKLGVRLRKNKTIEVDAFMRANDCNIFAAGDITGPYQFTHVASHQAWYCAVNALFRPIKKFKVNYDVIPWVTYTDPEVAQVGLNENTAIAQGIPYEVTKYGIDDLDRAIAESADHGFVKVLTAPGKDKVLGCTIVSHQAGELITEFVSAMKHGFGLNSILGTIHSYPTMSEANKYAAGDWKKAHTPDWALKFLRKYHSWRR